ncbi:MAG: ABC transporter permease [Candidatus Methanodesulfokora sp.]
MKGAVFLIEKELSKAKRYKFFIAMRFTWFAVQVAVFGVVMSRMVTISRFYDFYLVGVYSSILFTLSVYISYEILEEAEDGLFEYFLSLPMGRWEFVMGRSVGCAISSLTYTIPMLLLVLLLLGNLNPFSVALALLSSLLFAIGISGIVITFVSLVKSSDVSDIIFGAVDAILVRLSTAMYPLSAMPSYYKLPSIANPITHLAEFLRYILSPDIFSYTCFEPPGSAIAFLLGFSVSAFMIGILLFERKVEGGGWR